MAEQLVVKSDAKPTMFNKEMAIGSLLFFPVGTLVGGWIGKKRMENEQVAGKVLSSEPSFWNKDTLLGGLLGELIGTLVAAAVVVGTVIAMGPTAPAGIVTLGKMGLAAGGLLGMVAGGYLGGRSGQEDLKKEYVEALHKDVASNVSKELSKSLSQEDMQSVGQYIANNKSWAEGVLQQELMAAGKRDQQPGR